MKLLFIIIVANLVSALDFKILTAILKHAEYLDHTMKYGDALLLAIVLTVGYILGGIFKELVE